MSMSKSSSAVFTKIRSSVLLATILTLLTCVASQADETVPSNAENCSFDVEGLSVVRATRAAGNDLEVIVDWNNDPMVLPATAEIHLFDGDGNLVVTKATVPVAAQRTTTVMMGVLANVLTTGFQYHLEVTDSFGSEMAVPHHFRVVLDCSGGGGCGYQTVDGLRAGSVSVGKELLEFLDDLDDAGSSDVLGDAMALRPWLLGEILTLGEQLSDLDGEYGLEDCVCFWNSGYAHDPRTESSLDPVTPTTAPPYPDFETGGSSGPGAGFSAGLQMIRGLPQQLTLGGRSELIMDLRCWNFAGWRHEPLPQDASTKAETEIRVPVVRPCDMACDPEIRNQAELWGKIDIEDYGTPADGGRSEADLDVLYYLVDRQQGYPQFSTYSVTNVQAHAQGASTDLVCTHKAADQTFERSRIDAVLKTSSTLDVAASTEGYSVARSSVGFWMETVGVAACAIEPIDSASWYPGRYIRDDGLEIDLWGYPR